MIVWACSRQKVSNKFIEHFNDVLGGKKRIWRIMCKYDDKANMEHQRRRRHSKGCYHVARVSLQGPSLVDIIIKVVVNKVAGDY